MHFNRPAKIRHVIGFKVQANHIWTLDILTKVRLYRNGFFPFCERNVLHDGYFIFCMCNAALQLLGPIYLILNIPFFIII